MYNLYDIPADIKTTYRTWRSGKGGEGSKRKPHRVTGINWDMSENKKEEQELKGLVSKLQKAL
jgi:hypothetical protein